MQHFYREGLKRLTLVFIITENCNLNCVYCYETHKGARCLSAQFIKQKIFEEMTARDGYSELSIEFFGGEPLLGFKTIREVVDWFGGVQWPEDAKKYRFVVTTNGTLLDDAKKEWFSRNKDHLTLCLSLDGTREAHNLNRSNSYDEVIKHTDFFRDNWATQPVKMTISPQTINLVYDGIVQIHELGLQVEPDVVFEDVWGSRESLNRAVQTYVQQLDKLVQYCVTHPQRHRPSIVSRPLLQLFAKDDTRYTYCGAGKQLRCFMPDGSEYPCFRLAPISTVQPLQDILSRPQVENPQCNRCLFERICPSCEGLNYALNGSCFNRTTFHCRFYKASLIASAKLLLLENGGELLNAGVRCTQEDDLDRLRKLLAIRAIIDHCDLTN